MDDDGLPNFKINDGGTATQEKPNVVLQAETPKMDDGIPVFNIHTDPNTGAPISLKGAIDETHKALDYIGAGFGQSQDDTRDAVIWSGAMMGLTTDDEAALMTSRSEVQRQRDAGLKAYEMAHEYTIQRVVKEIVGTVPYLAQIAKDTIPIAAAGTAVGAAGGALMGGEATLWTPPGVDTIAIPAGAGAGALVGGQVGGAAGVRTGIALSAARLSAGGKFKQLYHDEKVPREDAMKMSLAYGAMAGMLQAAQFARFAIVTTKALQAAKPILQKSALRVVASLAKEMGIVITIGEAQEAANITVDSMIGHSGLHKPPDSNEIVSRLKTAGGKSAVIGAAGLVTAHVTGLSFRQAAEKVNEATTREAGAPTAEETALLETKAELKAAKAEESHAAAKAKLAEAKAEGKPTKAASLAVDVAKQELDMARAEVPVKLIPQTPKLDTRKPLQGRVEQSAVERLAQAKQDHYYADKKVSRLEQEAIDYKADNLDTPIPSELEGKLAGARKELQMATAFKRHAERDAINEKINEINDAAHSKFTIESDETDKKEFDRNQKLMHGLVSKSGLPKDLQGEFNTAIRDSKTTKQLLKLAPIVRERIAAKLENVAHEDAIQKLEAQVKRVKPRLQNGHPFSRFTHEDDIQKILDLFAYYIKNQKAVSQAHREFIDAEQKGSDVSELYVRHEVARTVGDLETKSANEIYRLADRIEELIDSGLKGRAKEIANQDAQNKADAAALVDAIQGSKPIELGVSTNAPRKDLSGLEKYANRAGTTLFDWRGKLLVATMDTPGAEPEVLKRLDISRTVRDVSHSKLTDAKRLFGHLEEHTGLLQNKILKLVAEGSNDANKFIVKYENNEGTIKHMVLTPMQGVDMLMKISDPSLNVGQLTRNEDAPEGAPTFERGLRNALAEKDLKYFGLAEGYLANYQEMHGPLAKAVKTDTGIELPKNPDYPGLTIREGVKDKALSDQFNLHIEEIGKPAFNKVGANRPDFIRKRDSNLELVPQNAHIAATKYINASAQYRGWVSEAKRLAAILTNRKVTEAMRHKFGPELHRDIMSHLKAAVRGGVDEQAALVDLVNHLMRNVPVAALGLKPLMAVKHALSIQNTMLLISPKDLLVGTVDYWANKRKADAIIESSKAYEVRSSDPTGNLLGFEATTNKNVTEQEAARRWMLLPIWGGANQFAIRPGMWAVRRTALLKGKTSEQAMNEAERVPEFQTSGAIDQLSNAARSPIIRPFTLFHQLPARLWQETWLAWGKFFRERSLSSLKTAIGVALITHIGFAVFPLVDALWKELVAPNQDMKDQAWFQFWLAFAHGPMPLMWGETLDAAAMKASNEVLGTHFHPFELNTIQAGVINNSVKLFGDLLKDVTKGTWGPAEFIELGLDFARSGGLLLGVPLEPPLKLMRLGTGTPGDDKQEMH